MNDVITILLPEDLGAERLKELQSELRGVEEVADSGTATKRAIGAAELALWVGFAADALAIGAVASTVLGKIIDRLRKKRVRGAVIELPNGVRISVDSATPDEVLAMASAWKKEEARWSRGKGHSS